MKFMCKYLFIVVFFSVASLFSSPDRWEIIPLPFFWNEWPAEEHESILNLENQNPAKASTTGKVSMTDFLKPIEDKEESILLALIGVAFQCVTAMPESD